MGILYLPMLGVGVGQGDVMQWEGVDEYVWTILNDDEDAHGLELFVDDRRLHFGAACCGDGLHVACVRAVENSSSGLGCRTGGIDDGVAKCRGSRDDRVAERLRGLAAVDRPGL